MLKLIDRRTRTHTCIQLWKYHWQLKHMSAPKMCGGCSVSRNSSCLLCTYSNKCETGIRNAAQHDCDDNNNDDGDDDNNDNDRLYRSKHHAITNIIIRYSIFKYSSVQLFHSYVRSFYIHSNALLWSCLSCLFVCLVFFSRIFECLCAHMRRIQFGSCVARFYIVMVWDRTRAPINQ